MNKYPAKPLMDEMAKYGRYGDSMLVHMHPAEVQGLASLVPGGRLPRNPVTGQPEAFYFLIPMLMNAAGAGLTALQGAAITGAASAVVNKDIGKGILDGITAGATAGIGDAISGALKAGTETATQAATQAAAEGAAEVATEGAVQTAAEVATSVAPEAAELAQVAIQNPQVFPGAAEAATATREFGFGLAGQDPVTGAAKDLASFVPPSPSSAADIARASQLNIAPGPVSSEMAQTIGVPNDAVRGSMLDRINAGINSMDTMGQLGIAGVAQGAKGDMEMREAARARGQAMRDEAEKERRGSFEDLQRAYSAHGIPTGLSDARSEMSYRTPLPMYAKEGGSTSTKENENDKRVDDNPYAQQGNALGAYRDVARFIGGPRGYFGVDPVTVQQRLRGPDTIAPPRDYMPGFEPEFSYFQDASEGISVPDRSYRPMRQGVISRGQYFDPILQAPQSNAQMNEYRRTLEQMDPGPLDIGSVMGLASEGSTLSTPQQNVFQAYYSQPPAPEPEPDTTTDDTTTSPNTEFPITDQLRSYFPGMTDQEIRDRLASYQSGNIFTLANNITDPTAANALALSMQAGVGPNDVSPLGSPEALMAMYPNLTEAQARALADLSVNPLPFNAGGQMPEVRLQTSLGETSVPSGGIAQVPTEFTGASEQQQRLNKMTGLPFGEEGEDVMRDVQALEAAVLGEVSEELAEQITNMFVQKYGPDVYRVARESILRRSTPNAQTEGMISGQGSGMDDMVQGMIGSEQPVAVSPGEFIVPADVVSGLGEGSSDAGAKKLDEMMDRVRMERNGTTRQAPPIDERKVMPA